MKRIILYSFLLLIPFIIVGQEVEKTIQLEGVTVTARRLTDIGVTRTKLDTIALRENVTNSLAEVLTQNTSIFIKSYGRGSLTSASFRGTAPSHTQVTWNDLKLNSPMLGMVDFSLIPSFFIDDAGLYHGAGSVEVAGGGLGGAITLSTKSLMMDGLGVNFIQGISSFSTFDEFLRVNYGGKKFHSSTRIYYVNSGNDFSYINYYKDKEGGEYVIDQNKNGSFRDFHILQELYYNPNDKNKLSLSAWLLDSDRGVPMLNVDYRAEDKSKNQQKETTFRMVAGWDKYLEKWKFATKGGYVYSNMVYHYFGDRGTEDLVEMIHSQSQIYTGYGRFAANYYPSEKLLVTANISAYVHSVSSREKYVQNGYEKTRAEIAVFFSTKYRLHPRLGIGVDLREETYGNNFTPLIPAAFIDYTLWPKYNVVLKASAARNYRYPTLNDLYFLPGGNDTLKTERGYTYEGGIEFSVKKKSFTLTGEGTVYNSHINDWILWLPTFKGFWSPINVRKVHSYGVELKGKLNVLFDRNWILDMDGNWAWTRSVNHGDPMSWTDDAIGKQLVYVPEYSAAVTGKLSWKGFAFSYKFNYYSERFTTSSNEIGSKVGKLGVYYMNDISLEKIFTLPFANISLKFNVYNLFNESYVSVLSRPMAGRNYGIFIGITPVISR